MWSDPFSHAPPVVTTSFVDDRCSAAEIRKVIYTTNAIESVNMGLRKVTKSRGAFPNNDALIKLYYLALRNISKKWTISIQNWKAALNRLTMMFDERMPRH
jgi:putative transposase